MTANNIRSHSFQTTDRIFFDTNIWLLINNPFGNETGERVRVYSNAYREIIDRNLKIHIDATVLSEFINRATRMRYDQWKSEDPEAREEVTFKQYRATGDYKDTIKAVCRALQSMLIDCKLVNTNLLNMELSKMISTLENGQYDFNDLLVVEMCKLNDFVLVTDDADYRGMPISILTCNRKLLAH